MQFYPQETQKSNQNHTIHTPLQPTTQTQTQVYLYLY